MQTKDKLKFSQKKKKDKLKSTPILHRALVAHARGALVPTYQRLPSRVMEDRTAPVSPMRRAHSHQCRSG